MKPSVIRTRMVIHAPVEHVFAAVSDHEGMSDWPGIRSCTLVREGSPRNGLGAVRRIKLPGLSLDEEVVSWDPPRCYSYSIVRGLPVEHLGTVTLEPDGDHVELTWEVRMTSKIPMLAGAVALALKPGLEKALRTVRTRLEAQAGTSS